MSALDLAFEKLDGAKRYANYVHSLCPFHQDKHPSFFVYPDKYFCKSCGAHGKTSTLVNKLSSLPDRIVIHERSTHSNNPFSRWLLRSGLFEVIRVSNGNLSRRGSHYLDQRGVSVGYQHTLSLGILDGYITFPIYNNWKELVGAVARVGENNTASSKYYLPAGQNPKLLYVPSWDMIKQSTEVFVTFGIIDAISLHIMGFASASTTTGQSVNPSAFDHIRKRIIIIPDKYEEASANKLAAKLGWRGSVLRLPFPYKCKDVNDFYIKDKDALKNEIYGIKEQNSQRYFANYIA